MSDDLDPAVDARFRAAVECHQSGRLEEATLLYRQILDDVPGHAPSLHMRGVLFIQLGQLGPAVEALSAAVAADPSKTEYRNDLGEAYRIAKAEMHEENQRIQALHDRMLAGLKDIEQVFINGHETQRVPHNLNMSFNYVEGESLIMGIKGLAVSSGSACTSASLEPSYVLRALGRSDELAHSSLRITIGRFTSVEDIDYAVATLQDRVAKLRELSPLWEMFKDGVDLNSIQWSAH